VVVLGGSPANDGVWSFDGTAWVRETAAFTPIVGAGLAFDSARSRLVLFGGSTMTEVATDSTWER
jgi:hypothetical protein